MCCSQGMLSLVLPCGRETSIFLLALLSCSLFFPKGISGHHITVEGGVCLEMRVLFHPCHSYHVPDLAAEHGR